MRYGLVFGALAIAAAAAILLGRPGDPRPGGPVPSGAAVVEPSGPVRPRQPPVRAREPRPLPDEPSPPVPTPEMRSTIAEKARGADRPGLTAFRTFTDLYVDANLEFATRQAESERITVAEVRELTHFGLLVQATQRVSDLEEVLGRALSDDQREALGELMVSANREFKDQMRSLVASGAGEAQRWELIRTTEARYLAKLYAGTGLDESMLDDLLAGNMLLPGAPIGTEPPSGPVPPADPADHELHPTRAR